MLHDVVAEHVQHRVKRKHEKLVDNNRRRRCFQDVEPIDVRNKPVYVNGEHLDNMAHLSGARDTFLRLFANKVDAAGGDVVNHPVAAAGGLFVVSDPASPPIDILLVASLAGGAIMDIEYFQSSGRSGSNISYMAGVKVKQTIFISDAAKASSPEPTTIIESIITAFQGSNWRMCRHEPPADVLAASFLVILSDHEKHTHPDFARCRYALDISDFLTFVQKLDLATCTAGLCRK